MKDNCGPGMTCAGWCGGNCSGSYPEPEAPEQGDECECEQCQDDEAPEPACFVERDEHRSNVNYALGYTHGWVDADAREYPRETPRMERRGLINGLAIASIVWFVATLFLLACPRTAKSQMLAPNVEATTPCLNGKTKTIVDLAVIVAFDTATKTFAFTDSADEVIGHEMIHQAQARRWAPACPPYGLHPELLLRDEVEAYCYTRRMYLTRTHRTKEEVNQDIEGILQDQFGSMTLHDVAVAWERGCP